jgi:hypothetical protein
MLQRVEIKNEVLYSTVLEVEIKNEKKHHGENPLR